MTHEAMTPTEIDKKLRDAGVRLNWDALLDKLSAAGINPIWQSEPGAKLVRRLYKTADAMKWINECIEQNRPKIVKQAELPLRPQEKTIAADVILRIAELEKQNTTLRLMLSDVHRNVALLVKELTTTTKAEA